MAVRKCETRVYKKNDQMCVFLALTVGRNFTQLLVAITTFVISWSVIRWRRQLISIHSDVRRPPCLPTVPILGSLPFLKVNMDTLHQYFMEQAMKYGNVFALYIGPRYE
jgi:hypothetical protein